MNLPSRVVLYSKPLPKEYSFQSSGNWIVEGIVPVVAYLRSVMLVDG